MGDANLATLLDRAERSTAKAGTKTQSAARMRRSSGNFDELETWTYAGMANVGAALRGTFRRAMRRTAFALGLALDIDEDKGLLASDFFYRVTGESGQVDAFIDWLARLDEAMAKETD